MIHRLYTIAVLRFYNEMESALILGQRTGAVGDTHFIDVVNCKMINFAG